MDFPGHVLDSSEQVCIASVQSLLHLGIHCPCLRSLQEYEFDCGSEQVDLQLVGECRVPYLLHFVACGPFSDRPVCRYRYLLIFSIFKYRPDPIPKNKFIFLTDPTRYRKQIYFPLPTRPDTETFILFPYRPDPIPKKILVAVPIPIPTENPVPVDHYLPCTQCKQFGRW